MWALLYTILAESARSAALRSAEHASSARLVPLAVSAYTTHFARAESQTQAGVIYPSLTLLAHSVLSAYTTQVYSGRITDADRHHLPITPVACSFSTFGILCSFCSGRITHADRHYLSINRVARSFSALGTHCSLGSHRISSLVIALFALQERHLVAW